MIDKAPLVPFCAPEGTSAAVSALNRGFGGLEEHSSDGSNSHDDLGRDSPTKELAADQQWEEGELLLMQERLARAGLLLWPRDLWNQTGVAADDRELEDTFPHHSDGSISSLSSVSQRASSPHDNSAVSSIEEIASDTSSEASLEYRHESSASDMSERTSDALALDESVSSLDEPCSPFDDIKAVDDEEDSDACSLPSSISSLSSTSPRYNSRAAIATAASDRIENIPHPLARECGTENERAWTDALYWDWNEYVKPEVLSSLSCASDLDLDISTSDEGSVDDGESQAAPLIESVEKVFKASDLFPCNNPPPLSPVECPTAYDAYVGFDELRNVFHEFFPHRDAMILDVGCGTSNVCRQLVLHGFSNVHGIDSSSAAIAFQKQKSVDLEAFVQFSEMSVAAMTFPESHFESVFTKAVLDRLASAARYGRNHKDGEDSELQRVVSEITRCLRPGGLWISVSCQDSDDLHDPGSPWWDWPPVKQFVSNNYIHVKTYRCGTPFLHRGKLLKPFAIQIYRKRESTSQKLERWACITFKTKQLQWQLDIRDKWRREQHRQYVDLQVVECELPVMLAEDHRSRLANADAVYGQRRQQRVRRRATLRAQVIIRERIEMEEEDAMAECVRMVTAQVTELARNVVLACVGGFLSTIDTSPKEVAANSAASTDGIKGTPPPPDVCKEVTANGDTTSFVADIVRDIVSNAFKEEVADIVNPRKELKATPTTPETSRELPSDDVATHVVADIVRELVTAAVASIVSVKVVNTEVESGTLELSSASQSISPEVNESSAEMPPENPRADQASPHEAALPQHLDGTEPPISDQDETPFAACEGDTGDASTFALEEQVQVNQGHDDRDPLPTQTSSELEPEHAVDFTADQSASSPASSTYLIEEGAVGLWLMDILDQVLLESSTHLAPVKSVGEATAITNRTIQAPGVVTDVLVEGETTQAPCVTVADPTKDDSSHSSAQSGNSIEQSDDNHDFSTTKSCDLPMTVASSERGARDVDTDCQETLMSLVDRICSNYV